MQTKSLVMSIIALLVAFGLPVVLVSVILYYKHLKLKLTHETVKGLVEKGLPVPPQLLDPPRRGHSELRGGLVLVAMGIALAIFFWDRGGPWSIGLIPGLMGVALLIAWRMETRAAS
jgi:hypothetical protein